MRAVVCRRWGGPADLTLEDMPRAPLDAGQVRIKTAAAGVSFATTLVISGRYQRKPPFPFTPGTEVVGTVVEAASDVRRFKVGDAVYAVIDWGGLAEEAVAREVNAFPLPSAVEPVHAVGLPISYPTAAGALLWPHLLDVREGKTLMVHGAGGGVGMAAVEIGKAVGATVIAVAGGDEKLALAKSRGADLVVDHRAGPFRDAVLAFTKGRGVDAVLDPVGGEVFAESIRCLAVEGRLCPVGFAGGAIPSAPANILLVKNVSVVGWNYGYYVGWSPHDARFEEAPRVAALNAQLFEWAQAGKLRPHTSRTFRLDQYVEALDALATRSVVGRIAIVP